MTIQSRPAWPTIIAIGVVVFGLSALGPSAEGAGQEAAQLVTQQQVEDALGTSVTVETRGANGYSYTSTSPAGGVTIDITSAEVVAILKGDSATIEGLGDEAFFQSSSSRMAILIARKGTKAITLSVLFPLGLPDAVSDIKELAQDLAALALAKL